MARPKGLPKTGGRKKGTPNRTTLEQAQKALGSGLSPLEFLLKEMRDESNEKSVRIDAAKAAAPYVHPKFATVEVTGKDGEPLMQNSDPMEMARSIAFILNQASKGK